MGKMDAPQYDVNLSGATGGADLHVIYPSRKFISPRSIAFIDALKLHFTSVKG
jgi:hypothetical protein